MNLSEKISLILVDKGFSLSPKKNTEDLINSGTEFHKSNEDIKIAEQHGIADQIFILLKGEAEYVKYHNNVFYKLATLKNAGSPLGISGLNAPGRYMSDIFIKGNSEYISIKIEKLKELEEVDPDYASFFYSFLLFESINLIWSSRNLEKPIEHKNINLADGVKTGGDIVNTKRIKNSAFLAFLDDNDLDELIHYANVRLFSSGEFITLEGKNSDGINILLKGKVEASFTNLKDDQLENNSRSIARPGVALSLSSGLHEIESPYSLKATRDTTILKFSNEFIDNLIKTNPELAIKFFKRQLWQLGRYIQSSTGLTTYPAKNEKEFFQYLLNDNSATIPSNSKLYTIPHLLENHLTHSLAFDTIYDLIITGNDDEKSIASLMIDALSGIERKNRFFKQLNKIYNRVATSYDSINKQALQKLTNSDFIKAFDQVPYVIKGMKNLPDEPTNIFFYNHLASIEENGLANGHQFSIDSHFISAKILFPKYGDGGQRIARYSRNTEFWRYNYYENLDYIFVHTPESDYLNETQEQKKKRKSRLFIETQNIFDQNRPLVIAPEGTSETEDNLTPNSPGPLKPGAFLLAEEAIELAKSASKNKINYEDVVSNLNLVSPIEEEFEADVRELEIKLHSDQYKNNKIVLFGSSTFRDWENAKTDLSFDSLLNLGFGGSTLVSCRTYFNRIVVPNNPDKMIFYAGDNDIGSGMSAEDLENEFLLFASEVNEKLPHTLCFFVSIKPSVFRNNYLNTILDANERIKNKIENFSQWRYIDLCSPMLDAGFEKFYSEDPLHMNVLGYSLLSKLIRDEISKFTI